MKWIVLVGASCTLGACTRSSEIEAGGHDRAGRYQGVGIYSPDQVWSQQTANISQQDKADATLDDDGQIIVVVDSKTGELRQCGNMSARCLTMNPWQSTSAIKLQKHRAELRAQVKGKDGESIAR